MFQCVFPLVHWSIGPLVHWSSGPLLVHCSIGPLVHWLNVKCHMSDVKNQMSNVNKVKTFVGAHLRSSSGHFYPKNHCKKVTLHLFLFNPVVKCNVLFVRVLIRAQNLLQFCQKLPSGLKMTHTNKFQKLHQIDICCSIIIIWPDPHLGIFSGFFWQNFFDHVEKSVAKKILKDTTKKYKYKA